MNVAVVGRVLGGLLVFTGSALIVPLLLSILDQDSLWDMYLATGLGSVCVGVLMLRLGRNSQPIRIREGFGAVTLGWMAIGAIGAVPFVLSGALPSWIDAYFESIAGFTTTGSSVISDIEALPRSLLLWRSLIQWIGGMGIVLLSIAILPFLKVGGMKLYHAEVPGSSDEKLTPRIQDTAKLLWIVYAGLTTVLAALLFAGGVNAFESICHALTTMATGGFSTRNASIGGFENSYVHWVLTLFMLIAGTNFSLHTYLFVARENRFWRNEEFRWYVALILASTAGTFVLIASKYDDLWLAARDASFQVATLVSSTGFATVDYAVWPPAVLMIFVFLMTVGGMAGSTAGGVKVVRVVLAAKHSVLQMFFSLHPKAVRVVKLDGKALPDRVLQAAIGFVGMYAMLFLVLSFVLTLTGMDLVSSTTAILSALGNMGPGLGVVGPASNYASIPDVAKVVVTLGMLLGRLELFTVLMLVYPDFWRR